jgi:phosphohistidine phosphatase SixA
MASRTSAWKARALAGVACAVAGLSLAAGPGARPEPALAAEARTVVIVRHAEKDSAGGEDPALSAPGEARARDLARLLGASGVTHLFASEYRRTEETLAPLAAGTGLTVAERPARESERLLEELRGLPAGSLAVVAGHSNTLPGLVRGLAGRGPETIGDDEYDRLFVVTHGSGCEPALLELRYGD